MGNSRSQGAPGLGVVLLLSLLALGASPVLAQSRAGSPPRTPPGIPQSVELLREQVGGLQARVRALEALHPPRRLLLIQRDALQAFDVVTGQGQHVGTATGQVSGTTSVQFQYAPAGPPHGDVLPILFHNDVTVTDIDGDQLVYSADGTGSFHLGIPGSGFRGTGGPLTGTYVVTGGTGKYSAWTSEQQCPYRAVATMPPSGLGTAYVELSECD
jgi:hypothetical protein